MAAVSCVAHRDATWLEVNEASGSRSEKTRKLDIIRQGLWIGRVGKRQFIGWPATPVACRTSIWALCVEISHELAILILWLIAVLATFFVMETPDDSRAWLRCVQNLYDWVRSDCGEGTEARGCDVDLPMRRARRPQVAAATTSNYGSYVTSSHRQQAAGCGAPTPAPTSVDNPEAPG